jgi:transcriptional regulator with XRE-family HTH domain
MHPYAGGICRGKKHPVASPGTVNAVNAAIREAFVASGLTLREMARRLYDDPGRKTDFKKIMEDGRNLQASTRIRVAEALGLPSDEFLDEEPIVGLAKELAEVTQVVEAGFGETLAAIEALARAVAQLER